MINDQNQPGMTLIVKTVTRYTVWLILFYGLYLVIFGHLSPGGGFAGGMVIALSYIHLTLAFGRRTGLKVPDEETAHVLDVGGALIFAGIGLISFLLGLPYLTNFLSPGTPFTLWSAGTIPILNLAIALKVGMGFFLLYQVLLHLDQFTMKR
ncbi:MAG TPA: MnhB domain-containing protein [Atribacteraceae bacterium]|nr:MnhB domain-containing protein [Atribacteraceae bacterium]